MYNWVLPFLGVKIGVHLYKEVVRINEDSLSIKYETLFFNCSHCPDLIGGFQWKNTFFGYFLAVYKKTPWPLSLTVLNLKIRSYTSYFFISRLYEILFVRSKDNGTDSDTSAQPSRGHGSRQCRFLDPLSHKTHRVRWLEIACVSCPRVLTPCYYAACATLSSLMANVSIHSFRNGSKPPVRYRA